MKKENLSEDDLDKLLSHLSGSARSPQGKYSANESYPVLRKRMFGKTTKRFSFLRYAAAAASVALIISLSTYFFLDKSPEMITVATTNNIEEITLPDESRVTLSRYSSLQYPSKFDNKSRNVTLVGEGYFDVAKDSVHAFIVHADNVNIKVLGTQFNVHSYPNDEYVKATLLEGAVSVSTTSNNNSTILKPNESAIFYKGSGNLQKETNYKALDDVAWREGKLIFKDKTLSEIAGNLSNYFNLKIDVKSQKLRIYKITARFEQNESIEEILNILQGAANFKWKHSGNTIIITSNP